MSNISHFILYFYCFFSYIFHVSGVPCPFYDLLPNTYVLILYSYADFIYDQR